MTGWRRMLFDAWRWVWCYPVCVLLGHDFHESGRSSQYIVRRCMNCPKVEVLEETTW
jgi:hypothetical protein